MTSIGITIAKIIPLVIPAVREEYSCCPNQSN